MSSDKPLFTSAFDAGNGKQQSMTVDGNSCTINVEIVKDVYTELEKTNHSQWFSFRISNVDQMDLTVRITNAGETSYPLGWEEYYTCASYDREHWFRVPTTTFKDGVLSWTLTSEQNAVYFAYFPPFSLEQCDALVARCANSGCRDISVATLGHTLDGRDVDIVYAGRPLDDVSAPCLWLVARQHPGESMASWWMQGFLRKLCDDSDAAARFLRTNFRICVVPNMNKDGSYRGHLRTNACGANLNREWDSTGDYKAPTLERSPEVYYVMEKLKQTGCSFFIDVHGDETLPYNFISGMEGVPAWGPRLEALQARLCTELELETPDFQTKFGYEPDPPMEGNMAICNHAVAQQYDCLSVTMEMPFKDTKDTPLPGVGWSAPRAESFGSIFVNVLRRISPDLLSDFQSRSGNH